MRYYTSPTIFTRIKSTLIRSSSSGMRKHFIRLLAVFLIYSVYVYVSSRKKPDLPNGYYAEVDRDVDTSGYLAEYAKYDGLKQAALREWQMATTAGDVATSTKKILKDRRRKSSRYKDEYEVLMFTKVFHAGKFCDARETTASELYVDQCPFKNCVFTCDRSRARYVDMIMFHAYDLVHNEDTETRYYLKKFLARLDSRQDQIWLLWHDEPHDLATSLNKFKFNWTLSYPHDSELSDCSYGCSYAATDEEKRKLKEREDILTRELEREFRRRKMSALWFVSNCGANFRNKFALGLKEHIEVRIYGNCREQFLADFNSRVAFRLYSIVAVVRDFLMLPINLIRYLVAWIFYTDYTSKDGRLSKTSEQELEDRAQYECRRGSQCEYDEFQANLFYLSFESRNCSGYITEKLWRILNTHMIPIVIQPNRRAYEQIAPAVDSFIHAEDFGYDTAKLADYLHAIANDFGLYMRHQRWRLSSHAVSESGRTEKRRMCELCTKLNTESDLIYYDRVSEWLRHKCSP